MTMPPRTDIDGMASMLTGLEQRIDQHDKHIDDLVATTVDRAVANLKASMLSDEERLWVKLAVQEQAQRVKFRQAIIDKTLTGLVWGALGWIGLVLVEYAKAHGMWKP